MALSLSNAFKPPQICLQGALGAFGLPPEIAAIYVADSFSQEVKIQLYVASFLLKLLLHFSFISNHL